MSFFTHFVVAALLLCVWVLPGVMSHSAVVLGASGATGKALVKELLVNPKWTKVTTIGRTPLDLTGHANLEKLNQVTIDMKDGYEPASKSFEGHDAVFCCLGTTIKKAGSQENFRKIDYDLVIQGGAKAKAANVPYFGLVSSMSANANSSIFYSRTKGEAEDGLKAQQHPVLGIFQPGLLMTERNESRPGESVAQAVFPYLSWMLPKNYKEISVETVAKAMIVDAERNLATLDRSKTVTNVYPNKVLFDMALLVSA
eukprot:Phypoly_transcript_16741.p1 GENE.Phypoly_transcript_16741~~Phypoly_transcript_16741.p1  ORF type:complete len:256 (+),score=44.59 Phypoly_transcript_16741:31-798(+)